MNYVPLGEIARKGKGEKKEKVRNEMKELDKVSGKVYKIKRGQHNVYVKTEDGMFGRIHFA